MLSFTENPEAYCSYIRAHQNRAAAMRMLGEVFADGSWSHAPEKWVDALHGEFWSGSDQVAAARELRDQLVLELVAGALDARASVCLPTIFKALRPQPLAALPDLVAWLITRAEPNDATLIADLVELVVYKPERPECDQTYPLVRWLLKRGPRELKSPRRKRLVASLLAPAAMYGDPRGDELLATLRFLLFGDGELASDQMKFWEIDRLAPALEQLLLRPDASSIANDLFTVLSDRGCDVLSDKVLRSWGEFPRLRAALLRHLSTREHIDRDVWRVALCGPPVELDWVHASAISELVANHHASHHPEAPIHEKRGAWGSILIREFLRLTRAIESPTEALRQVWWWLNDAAFSTGAARAFRDAVDSSPRDDLREIRDILEEQPDNDQIVRPCIELLLKKRSVDEAPSEGLVQLSQLEQSLNDFFAQPVPSFGSVDLARLLANVRHVAIRDLEGERAFTIDGGTLSVAKGPLAPICTLFSDPRDQRLVAALYAVHELVHAVQGIDEKADVSRVRFAGAESALMHIDLGADHYAAHIVHRGMPGSNLEHLKDLQGRSVQAFPAKPSHPQFARVRKTLRLVGLRTDFLVRRMRLLPEQVPDTAYAFADFSPGGGPFIVMLNDPLFQVIRIAEASSTQVSTLFSSIDGGSVEALDDVLGELLGGVGRGVQQWP